MRNEYWANQSSTNNSNNCAAYKQNNYLRTLDMNFAYFGEESKCGAYNWLTVNSQVFCGFVLRVGHTSSGWNSNWKPTHHPGCKNQKGKWAQNNSCHQRGKEPQRGESKRKWTQSSVFKLSLSLWISPKPRMCGHTGSSLQLKHKGMSWDLSCCSSEEGQCGVCIQTTQLPGEDKNHQHPLAP